MTSDNHRPQRNTPTKVDAIVAFVRQHPGCTRREILAGIGSKDEHDALPVYCRKRGLIFSAGPRGSQRYFPDEATARDADAAVQALRDERRRDAKRRENINRLAKLRAQRAAEGRKTVNTRPKQSVAHIDRGVGLHPDFRVTICPSGRDHRFTFTPPPGWTGQITRDWRERRLQEAR